MRHASFFLLPVCLALVFSGCREDEEIKVYRVARDAASPSPAATAPAGTMSAQPTATPSMAAQTGPAPAGWEAQPLSQMRAASFLVKGDGGALADVSLVVFGGDGGGDLQNVNRWRGQLGLPSVDEAGLIQTAEKQPTARGEARVFDLTGQPEANDPEKDGRILTAILPTEGKTLFFKMRGNTELVGAQKANFLQWVEAMGGASGQ